MDGFEADFSAAPPAAGEVDPAAEFLAKEQEDLGGLGEDLGFTSPTQDTLAANGDANFEFLSAEPAITGAPEEQEEIIQVSMGETPINPFAASFESPIESAMTGMQELRVREEPESIKRWKIEQEEKLRVKDENERQKLAELKAQARQELEDWYKHYEEQLKKTKETNRNAEETLVAGKMNDIAPGTEWERVATQCDFNAKTARNTKDVSRMRGILLQLKQNPPTRD